MKTDYILIIAGAAAALAAALNDRFFAMPPILLIALALAGIGCLVFGCALLRGRSAGPVAAAERDRLKHYVALLVAVGLGVCIGFVVFNRVYTSVPIEARVLIGTIAFGGAALFFAWDVFFRRRGSH